MDDSSVGRYYGFLLRKCECELRSTIEDWVLVGLRLGHRLPKLADIDLNKRQHDRVASAQNSVSPAAALHSRTIFARFPA